MWSSFDAAGSWRIELAWSHSFDAGPSHSDVSYVRIVSKRLLVSTWRMLEQSAIPSPP